MKKRSQTKAAFVRSLPPNTPAKEVVEQAKAQGLSLTTAHVYAIRTNDRRRPKPADSRPVVGQAREIELLKALAASIGLSRAIAILEAERMKWRRLLGSS
jgi:hypothetical protein